MRHLLKLSDLTAAEILEILDLGDELKRKRTAGEPHRYLEGKSLGMIFRKASTRTRVSFEVGMYELGGSALFCAPGCKIDRGEPVQDTARVLSRYLHGIMIRTYAQKEAEDLAKYGSIPVINGLTDYAHPCQVLADLMTIRARKKELAGRKLCFVGDGNNMANSLIVGGIKTGMSVSIACPNDYRPDAQIMRWAAENGAFVCTESVEEAVSGADVVYTDVWASMGQEEESRQRMAAFQGYQVNAEVMRAAKPDAMVLHCLPAHRGEEITDEVLEAHAQEIFDEAENRLHAQKAVLVRLMS